MTLAECMESRLGGAPAVGDRTRFGAVELIVRDMQGDEITQVGVELDPASKQAWRSWFQLLLQRLGWNNRGRGALRHSLSETERHREKSKIRLFFPPPSMKLPHSNRRVSSTNR